MLEEDGQAFLDIDRTLHASAVIKGGGKKKAKKITYAELKR